MESMERSLLHVTLAIAVTICLVMVIVNFVTSRGEVVVAAAVPHTPVVVDLQFELHRGSLTVAVLARLEDEHSNPSAHQDFAQGSSTPHVPTLHLSLRQPGSRALVVTDWRQEEERTSLNPLSANNYVLNALIDRIL